MTTEQKFKWEKIDSLEKLKMGDELEFVCPGPNREFKYWGKVIEIVPASNARGGVARTLMEGDWTLLPSSLWGEGYTLTRKVKLFEWPEHIGACVKVTDAPDFVYHYVRVAESGSREWVCAETGLFSATWQLVLVSSHCAASVR